MYEKMGISPEVCQFTDDILEDLRERFSVIDETAEYNQLKVLRAMQEHQVSEACLLGTTGYGYNDLGRDTLEEVYASVFHTESALVRPQITCGTHALALALMSNLRPGDELLSPVGKPYDTLEEVIGIRPSKGSLKEYGISYRQVDLLPDGSFDYDKIKENINEKTRLVTIQRSKGYQTRPTLSVKRAAVGALPHLDARAAEDLAGLNARGELLVALLVGLLDGGDALEARGDFLEALLVRSLRERGIHTGPLVVLARGGIAQVGEGVGHLAAVQVLEPQLGMLGLVAGRLGKDAADLDVALLLGRLGVVAVLHGRLRLAGKRRLEVLARLRVLEVHCHGCSFARGWHREGHPCTSAATRGRHGPSTRAPGVQAWRSGMRCG